MLGNESRERSGTSCTESLRRQRKIVEQSSRVGIPGIDLIPDGRQFPVFEITRRQRGLACARRAGDPYQGSATVVIQQRKQPLPRHHAEQTWPADLCKRCFLAYPG